MFIPISGGSVERESGPVSLIEQSQPPTFFYGLFMDRECLRQRGLHPGDVELVRVDGYGLRIGERATLVKASSERCFGNLIQLESTELARLYGEDNLVEYQPVVLVSSDANGRQLDCVSYLLPQSRLSGRNQEYARQLATVARNNGLPQPYVEEIKTWMR